MDQPDNPGQKTKEPEDLPLLDGSKRRTEPEAQDNLQSGEKNKLLTPRKGGQGVFRRLKRRLSKAISPKTKAKKGGDVEELNMSLETTIIPYTRPHPAVERHNAKLEQDRLDHLKNKNKEDLLETKGGPEPEPRRSRREVKPIDYKAMHLRGKEY